MDDFLQIDPTALSDQALLEMLQALRGSPQHEGLAKQLARELTLRAIKAKNLKPKDVVKLLVQARPKSAWPQIAKEWAEIVGFTEEQFLKIASGRKISESS